MFRRMADVCRSPLLRLIAPVHITSLLPCGEQRMQNPEHSKKMKKLTAVLANNVKL
jgi:hypothetical protein